MTVTNVTPFQLNGDVRVSLNNRTIRHASDAVRKGCDVTEEFDLVI